MADFFTPYTAKASIIGPKAELWAIVDLNVREKPDTKAAKVGSVKAGMSVKDMQILPNNAMWYYSESQKGYLASGDGKKEYWSAKPVKAPKTSAPQGPTAPESAPVAPAAPGAPAAKSDSDNTVLLVAGVTIAVLLIVLTSPINK